MTRIAFLVDLTSASLMRRPTTSLSRSRRRTSTSGSSTAPPSSTGARGALHDLRVGLPCGLLLGFLLRAPPPATEQLPRDVDGRGELLLVVGPAFLQPILGHRAEGLRGDLLKKRLEGAIFL